jgi:hypothetical protein
LEHLVVQRVGVRRTERLPGRAVHFGAQQPAVVIQRPLAHHLEILRLVARCCRRVVRIEGVEKACALDRRLLDPIDDLRRGDAGGLQDGGHDVDHVDELLSQGSLVLDAGGPRHHHVLVGAAEPGCVLLEPVERRIEGPRPTCRHVVVGLLGAPNVVELHLLCDGQLTQAIEERHFIGRAERPAFGVPISSANSAATRHGVQAVVKVPASRAAAATTTFFRIVFSPVAWTSRARLQPDARDTENDVTLFQCRP